LYPESVAPSRGIVVTSQGVKIAVLGAGYMGSALAVLARERGHAVSLWGTWLDDALVRASSAGIDHPKLKAPLPGIAHHFHAAHSEALAGADAVLVAVTSEGVLPVLERVGDAIPRAVPVGAVCKGLIRSRAGRRVRISEAVAERFPAIEAQWVACAGPAKAMELARRIPRGFTFAARTRERAEGLAALPSGGHVVIEVTDDLAGVEACMALKNAYASSGSGTGSAQPGASPGAPPTTRGRSSSSRRSGRCAPWSRPSAAAPRRC
jgi:glycerol-3-phosphate dehydrogenase (NAD(P)+)